MDEGMEGVIDEEAIIEAEIDAENHAMAAYEFFSGGQLTCESFKETFKSNTVFVRKMALAADIPSQDLAALSDEELEGLFGMLDADGSGGMSFDEFVDGLVQFRVSRETQKQQEEHENKQAMLEEAAEKAMNAFENANFGADTELDLKSFIEAFLDPIVAKQVQQATGLPAVWFDTLDNDSLTDIFHQIDDNGNGTVSFKEWVSFLVQVRLEKYEEQKEDERMEKEIEREMAQEMEDAFDDLDEWMTGEFTLADFQNAFRSNVRFVRKVASACDIPYDSLSTLSDEELEQLFSEFDLDSSGTITFEEFIKGLAKIRLVREKTAVNEEPAEEIDEMAIMEAEFDAEQKAMQAYGFFSDGQLTCAGFIELFRSNPIFVRKMALAADIPAEQFKALSDEELTGLFQALDSDGSCTMSFDEFVEGLKQFRITQEVKKQQEQAEEKKSVVQEALEAAIASFEDANWGADKELDMPGFIDAFLDPIVAAQIQMATGLPQEWFDSLSYERLEQIFHEIDDNGNGTLDFEEWVTYLVQVRINTYEEQKEEERIEKEIENQLMDAAEDIFEDADEDWSGEFEFEEFVKAFRANPKFLRKVAAACDIPFEALEALGDMEISQLFDEFDTDKSGAISFEEFVKGLAKIRFIREKAKDEEEADDDDAFMDLQTAFEDADFSAEGELTYEDFSDALKDKNIVRTLARVTKIQEGILRAMDEGTKGEWFDQIDTDSSGTIDFNEWITAFMEIRKSMTEEMEQEFAALRASQMFCEDMAADAFDQVDADFINGLTLDKFLIAFRKNKGFVQNVAKAMNLHENYLRQLGDKELEAWFMELDSDFSGTVDFQEFVAGLVKIRELHFGDVDGMEDPGSPGLPPYVLPEFVRNLPELSEEAKSNLANAFKKYDKSAMGFDCEAATVASLLRDVHLVVDEKAAKKYIETAFPGKDLSKGLQLEDCEVLYKVALDAQPLWSKPLAKSASAGSLTVKDMQSQELRLRKIFDKYANSVSNLGIGAIEVDAVGPLLKDIGCMDTADYTPRYLDSFFKNRAPGPVQFPEIVGLCNAAMHHQLMACPSTTSLTLSKSLSQSASQLAKKGCKLPPIELGPMGKPLSGSPAIALRRKRSSPARIDMASATALQAWKN